MYCGPSYSSNFGRKVNTRSFTVPTSRPSHIIYLQAVSPGKLTFHCVYSILIFIINIIAVKPGKEALTEQKFHNVTPFITGLFYTDQFCYGFTVSSCREHVYSYCPFQLITSPVKSPDLLPGWLAYRKCRPDDPHQN